MSSRAAQRRRAHAGRRGVARAADPGCRKTSHHYRNWSQTKVKQSAGICMDLALGGSMACGAMCGGTASSRTRIQGGDPPASRTHCILNDWISWGRSSRKNPAFSMFSARPRVLQQIHLVRSPDRPVQLQHPRLQRGNPRAGPSISSQPQRRGKVPSCEAAKLANIG